MALPTMPTHVKNQAGTVLHVMTHLLWLDDEGLAAL